MAKIRKPQIFLVLLTVFLILSVKNTTVKADSIGQAVLQGNFTLESKLDSKLLTVNAKTTSAADKNGIAVKVNEAKGTTMQVFTLKQLEGDKYIINCSSNKRVFDVKRSDTAGRPIQSGNIVQIWSNVDQEAQEWIFTQVDEDYYKIAIASKPNLVIERSTSTKDGAKVTLKKFTGNDRQLWKLNFVEEETEIPDVNEPVETVISDGIYKIVPKISEKSAVGYSADNLLQIIDDSDEDKSKWKVTGLGDGYYTFTNQESSMNMDGSNKEVDSEVSQSEASTNAESQQWLVKDNGNGYYEIICKSGELGLVVGNSDTAVNAVLKFAVQNGRDEGLFRLVAVSTSVSSDTLLDVNMKYIEQIGNQKKSGDSRMCSAYALAYVRSFFDNKKTNPFDYWINGVGANWSSAGGNSSKKSGTAEMLAIAKQELAKGKVSIVNVYSPNSRYQHFLVVIGYNGNGESMEDFIVIDPWDGLMKRMNSYPSIESSKLKAQMITF